MTKQELKKIILSIPDKTELPDKYYRKYTNNWKSQTDRIPSGRAWIVWFLDKYMKDK